MHRQQPSGMRAFVIVWFGQIVSLLGSAMTGFGLPIWAYAKTGQATPLALTIFFGTLPLIIISPLAGALVDRSSRKLMMMISDLASGVVTIVLLLLLAAGRLEIWHLYVAAAVSSVFHAFQWPAFSSGIALMLPKKQLGRANGMMELAGSASGIFAPVLAGALMGLLGVEKGLPVIMLIDVATFAFAVVALLFVHIPQPAVTAEGREGSGTIWKESAYGFRYILKRPSLLGLQLVFMVGNLFSALAFPVMVPMILARSGSNTAVLGTVESVAAAGGVVGGLVMSAWGGPKRRVHGVLGGWILSGLLWNIPMGIARGFPGWAVASFLGVCLIPVVNGCNQAIWQSKVAPDVQGRVFSARRMIAWSLSTLATAVAGPLADRVFEPAMQSGGALASLFGGLVGTGPGAGMGLMFVIGGLGSVLAGVGGYLSRAVRDAETILPDYQMTAEPAAVPVSPEAS
jgi:DHA3 family macrolide efflux protein-like MFS transporter